MYAKTYGATTMGVDGLLITVEVDCANGLPAFDIVGLPDTAVRESKERVRTAIKNAGIALKQEKVTINLAPADVRKDSSGLDLPIAMGLLAAYGIVAEERMEHALFAAELSLEGKLRSIRGILPMTVNARQMGFRKIFVASGNANEALLVDGIEVYAVDTLSELVDGLLGKQLLRPAEPAMAAEDEKPEFTDDFADVQGQFLAKRALEIAAAGGHNVLMAGVPGSGKTMLARRMSSILPELTREEALEVTKIYSIAGMLPQHGGLMKQRPFRSPHHTISTTAMIGGGSIPRPGEVTLSHHGILFLDELPEFGKTTLEVLREPLEDRKITVSRVNATLTFPSSIILICSMNPCPCMEQYEISSSATYDPQNPYLPVLDESIATRMRNARIRRNLTTKQFAELAETSTVTISEFENGHRMQARYPLLKRMATILHVSPVWLAGFDALPDTTLVEKIHKARMYRLYTLTEAANFFHVDPKTFGAWEHGRGVIKKEYLDDWLNVLNVSVEPQW
ncbi:MAG: YifB family Mg chelatase-like AAA ATPase [Selenomonadaceae bacterium]|nr:YifB family Mg chelatase-like AAA ATPase [Selenomonadaceae bacterium]